ncbi:hypothetical protein NE237_026665 [Protea cynaroides]|uniref:BURP domain-containing protein n=1 Tax=Protea cynaroides TaxID=273540 RepID=A0A9Q0K0Q4_9MAGN|nr:hypothetical protein NE237_026665 [Protea cynaroides]
MLNLLCFLPLNYHLLSAVVFKHSMDLHLSIIGYLSLLLVVTNATVTTESDWKNWNFGRPKATRDHLPSASEERRASPDVDQLRNDPNAELYIQEKNLVPGTTTMDLHFTKERTLVMDTFLPRLEAELIPFSIIRSLKEAQVMKNTIKECEEPAVVCEEPAVAKKDKYCATSLESMFDFSTTRLGTNIQALSTELEKVETQKQKYTITTGGVKKMGSDEAVVCHDQTNVYTKFYCHKACGTRAYKVALVGADGTKVNAVTVCHTDTANWNPKHLAFEVLNLKPGATVCHFLREDQVVWVQK